MKGKLRYWLSSKKRQMAKLTDLHRQLTEAWADMDFHIKNTTVWRDRYYKELERHSNLTEQLHRVARERDQERKKRIEADLALFHHIVDRKEKGESK